MKKKILIGYFTPSKSSGINNYLYNVLDALRDNNMVIDALTCEYSVELEENLKKYNVKLYTINRLVHPIKRYKDMKKILFSNKYDIVYFNISEAYNCICNIAVYRYSDAQIITHSHSSKNDCQSALRRSFEYTIHKLCVPLINKYTHHFYACSLIAGKWLFGKSAYHKLRIIRNTVNTDIFQFDVFVREQIRNKFGFTNNDIVLGFAGNFVYQKNILFLIDVFKELCKKNNNIYLILLGDGELRLNIEQKIKKLKLENKIMLIGRVPNVYEYMSAMDAFVLPSLFEGLPIVGIEAQVNGLDCFFSDSITNEIKICELAHFINHTFSASQWADEIQKYMPIKRQKKVDYYNVLIDKNEQKNEFKDIFINGKL